MLYIVSMIGMYLGVQRYIEYKDHKLEGQIRKEMFEVFDGYNNRHVDVAYSGYTVKYEQSVIPVKPKIRSIKELQKDTTCLFSIEENRNYDKENFNEWKQDYGDLSKIYDINWRTSNWNRYNSNEDGWNLITIQCDDEGYYTTYLFPYAVGYIRQDYNWMYLPSIQTAVDEAFEFFTENEKSNFIKDFREGSYSNIQSLLNNCENEYYWFLQDSIPRFSRMVTDNITGKFEFNNYTLPYPVTYMYNGFYKVFVAETQPTTYTIRKKPWAPDKKEIKELWLYWGIGLTLIFVLIVIPVSMVEYKRSKIKNESLYNKLKRLCNPALYLKDYDKSKVDIANELYKRIIDTKPDDMNSLQEIQIIAVQKLKIILIDKEKFAELRELTNPQRYMKPYNADKVALANDLFARLTDPSITYDVFCEIEELSKQLNS